MTGQERYGVRVLIDLRVRDRLGIDMNGRTVIANGNGHGTGHSERPAERRERRTTEHFDVGQAALHRRYDSGRALAATVEVDERWRLLALVISPTPGLEQATMNALRNGNGRSRRALPRGNCVECSIGYAYGTTAGCRTCSERARGRERRLNGQTGLRLHT